MEINSDRCEGRARIAARRAEPGKRRMLIGRRSASTRRMRMLGGCFLSYDRGGAAFCFGENPRSSSMAARARRPLTRVPLPRTRHRGPENPTGIYKNAAELDRPCLPEISIK